MRHRRSHQPARASRSPTSERRLEVMSELIAHRGPDDDGIWIARARPRRLRPPPAGDHRPRRAGHQPMRDDAGRWHHLQRRDLQLPGAAPRARRRAVRTPTPTPRSSCAPTSAGAPTALDHLRGMFAFALWDERASGAVLRPRPLRHQAVLLRPGRRRPLLRVRGEGAAAVPAARSRPTSTASRTTSPSSSASPARRCSRASASCCPATACAVAQRRVGDRALLGGLLRPRLRPHRERTSRSASRRCCDESVDCTCAATCRSARTSAAASTRASSPRWPRCQHGARTDGVHRPFSEDARLRRERATRGRSPTSAGSTCTSRRHRRRRLHSRTSSASSTTSTTRSPARARSRSSWSREAAARDARSSSAARAATRSSAATRAT